MFRHVAILALAALASSAFCAQAAIEINQATQAQLETVKGIGPALSKKILDARQSGSFRNWADLQQRVSGVGPGSAARLSKAGLTVAGSGYEAAAGPAQATRSASARPAAKAVVDGVAAKPVADRPAPKAATAAAQPSAKAARPGDKAADKPAAR